MRRRSTTNKLIFEALRVLQETVRVLSDPECGADMRDSGTAARRMDSWRTKAARSKSDL